jgi:hypothetical protein
MYAELIYENGEVSVGNYDDEAQLMAAVTEQHNRAKTGKPNGPQGATASRVARVLTYDTHPGDYGTHGGMAKDEVKASIDALLKDVDVVDVQQLASQVSALNHPMVVPENPHDSRFKMEATGEVDLKGLDK